jgi:hypothetical protein
MDLSKVLDQLRKELSDLDAAILSLERMQAEARRRRPPEVSAPILRRHQKPATQATAQPRRRTRCGELVR